MHAYGMFDVRGSCEFEPELELEDALEDESERVDCDWAANGGARQPSRLGRAGAASRVAHLCPLRHEQEHGLLVVLAVVLAAAAAVAAARGARARRRGEPGA